MLFLWQLAPNISWCFIILMCIFFFFIARWKEPVWNLHNYLTYLFLEYCCSAVGLNIERMRCNYREIVNTVTRRRCTSNRPGFFATYWTMSGSNPFQKSCAHSKKLQVPVTRKIRPIRFTWSDDIARSTLWVCYSDEKFRGKKKFVVPKPAKKNRVRAR